MESFGKVLTELRSSKKSSDGRKTLSQYELAAVTDLSRPYISMLEREPEKKPSVRALAELCKHLATTGDRIQDDSILDVGAATRLVSAALEVDLTPALEDFEGLLIQAPVIKEELWVFTDMLAENQLDEVHNTTIENLRRGVKYRYFVADDSEWFRFLKSVEQVGLDLESSDVVAVQSASPLCFMRMALYDPVTDHPVGTVTTGVPAKQLRLRRLQVDQTLRIFHMARRALQVMLRSSEKKTSDPSLGLLSLLFASQKACV